MTAITVTDTSLRIRSKPLELNNPVSLKDTDFVNSGERLRSLFYYTFEETLKSLNLSPGVVVIPSTSNLGREYEYLIAIKKLAEGDKGYFYPGEAAIFKADIDEKSGFNQSKWGIGRYDETGSFIIPPDNYRDAQNPITVGNLKNEFQKFLKKFMPKVIEWDKKYVEGKFTNTHISHHLPDWFIVRMLNNLPDGSNVTLGTDEFDIAFARELAKESHQVRGVKANEDKVELGLWD